MLEKFCANVPNYGSELHDKTMMEKRDSQSKPSKNDENRTYEKLIMFWYSVMGIEREDRATRKGSQVKSSPNLIRYNVMGDILTKMKSSGLS